MNDLETLYRTHASAVLRFAWGLCGDRSQAEDIVSETFVRVLTRAPRIETRTALAYLLTIARNTYLSGQRRRKREVPLEDDLPAPDEDPAGRLHNEARLAATLLALRDLPEGERAALLLRVDHDLPYEEIAAALGISVGAAKVRVHRARLHLSSALESEGGHHEAGSDA
jgi:RNA polymerase sigma-70 factor (ECF subfamily)